MKKDPRVDEQIAQSPAFAQPILKHLRRVVHAGCPEAEETIKWSRPFFLYREKFLGNMTSFKSYCSFGFWQPEMVDFLRGEGLGDKIDESSGLFGKLTSVQDLPDEPTLLRCVREAVRLIDAGGPSRARATRAKAPHPEPDMPADLAKLLTTQPQAAKAFSGFSRSHRREYVEWINEAKRDETRQKRLATTLELLAEGKSLHWKYQR